WAMLQANPAPEAAAISTPTSSASTAKAAYPACPHQAERKARISPKAAAKRLPADRPPRVKTKSLPATMALRPPLSGAAQSIVTAATPPQPVTAAVLIPHRQSTPHPNWMTPPPVKSQPTKPPGKNNP